MAEGIGQAVRRKEDLRLVTGQGSFADDLPVANAAHAFMLRSPHAHARLRRVDAERAKQAPGVLLVLTGRDVAAHELRPIPHSVANGRADVPLVNSDGSERRIVAHPVLASEEVRFVGDGVAFVVAETLWQAKDAAELIEVEYEELPALTQTPRLTAASAPRLSPDVPENTCIDAPLGDAQATAQQFEKAAHRVVLDVWVQRVTGVHLEPRASFAELEADTGRIVLHASSGTGVVRLREEVSTVLNVPPDQLRVIAPPDVGGNFGTRNCTYPEFALVAWAARALKRPVKHVVERSEACISDFQARDLAVCAELALDAEGRFLALRCDNVSNVGAYTASFTALNKGAQLMSSVYAIPTASVRARAALSNTPPTIPYRSAGRPEAMFVIERIIDVAARQCGFDRVALRKKNIIPARAQPYANPLGVTYDSGDYGRAMQIALEGGDWKGFPKRQRAARKAGKLRGIGLANYVEGTSGAPRERSDITVLPEGRVRVVIGTQATGQGHETSFSQLVSDWLGVPFAEVDVRAGDTDFVKAGGGSHSGRSMRFASIVIRQATHDIIDKGKQIAAALLEVAVEDMEFAEGRFRVRGTDRAMGLYDVARQAESARVPETLRGPLAASSDQVTAGLAFPYGAQVCEVEIDPDTGGVTIIRYTAVDDVGRAVNPMIIHGQTHGGIAQGAGQALLEHCVFDADSGQPLAGSLMDYAMPRAGDFPSFNTVLSEIPATSHPLGFRPGGEGGTTPALAVVTNAIVDALSEFGVTHMDMPLTPEKIWRAIHGKTAP